jgi:hypothetical protein
MAERRLWIGLAGAGAILGLAGPFGTFEAMGVGVRLLYWSAVAVASYAIGAAAHVAAERLPRRPWPTALRIAVSGLAVGVPVTALLIPLNGFALDLWPAGWGAALVLAGRVTAVALLAQAVSHLAFFGGSEEGGEAAPAILARLQPGRRGRLLSLSAEDHYVRVRTDRGESLVLMRLADAMTEAAPEPGLRVHRSHWVAAAAVAEVRRSGDGAVVTLTTGEAIPVSRSNLAALREAGLAPRRG